MELIAIEPSKTEYPYADVYGRSPEVISMLQTLYDRTGYQQPWIGFLAVKHGEIVGSCGFKNVPMDNKVEIGYYTFPEYEGKGYASTMCRILTDLALAQQPETPLVITARTLPTGVASMCILQKNGYRRMNLISDPEDGQVVEWQYFSINH